MNNIAERLHEQRQIELAKSILEAAGYSVTKEDISEGIFGKGAKQKNKESGIIEKYLVDYTSAKDVISGVTTEIQSVLEDSIGRAGKNFKNDKGAQDTASFDMTNKLPKQLEKLDLLPAIKKVIQEIQNIDSKAKVKPLEELVEKITNLSRDREAAGIMKELNKLAKSYLPNAVRTARDMF